MLSELQRYSYNGARSLVLLHENHLRSFLNIWKKAKDAGVILPKTKDPDYESMQKLLRHVLRAARGYMRWMCEKLDLPNPEIDPTPDADGIDEFAQDYLEHVLDRWKTPLAKVPEEKFYKPIFTARWGVDYCIEAMLEHAVMHPIRHEFQLRNLMNKLKTK